MSFLAESMFDFGEPLMTSLLSLLGENVEFCGANPAPILVFIFRFAISSLDFSTCLSKMTLKG